MIQVALATASGTRICAHCEKFIKDRTILLTGGYDNPRDGSTTSFDIAFHPRCALYMTGHIQQFTGVHTDSST